MQQSVQALRPVMVIVITVANRKRITRRLLTIVLPLFTMQDRITVTVTHSAVIIVINTIDKICVALITSLTVVATIVAKSRIFAHIGVQRRCEMSHVFIKQYQRKVEVSGREQQFASRTMCSFNELFEERWLR